MRVLLVSLMIVVADQAAKLLVKGFELSGLGISWTGMGYASSRPVFGDFFRLTYIENPGMAFGIDVGGKLFFSLFSIVASAAIIGYLYAARKESLGFRFSLALILGGAVGNLIDRVFYGVMYREAPLFYGKVVDFIDIDFFDVNLFGYQISRWPVFNIADAAVTCGVVLLLVFHRSLDAEEAGGPVPGPPEENDRGDRPALSKQRDIDG